MPKPRRNSSTGFPARSSQPATTRISTRTAADFPELLRPAMGTAQEPHLPEPGQPRGTGSPGALPYFDYFGDRAGPAGRGVLQLHSRELAHHLAQQRGRRVAGPGAIRLAEERSRSQPGAWKQATRTRCTLAYWHHPLFTSGPSGGTSCGACATSGTLLNEYGVDVAIAGHDHVYERHAPQDAFGPPRRVRHPAVHRRHRRRPAVQLPARRCRPACSG